MSRVVNDLNEVSELAHHGPEDIFYFCCYVYWFIYRAIPSGA